MAYIKMSAFKRVARLLTEYMIVGHDSNGSNIQISFADFWSQLDIEASGGAGQPIFFTGTQLPSENNTGDALVKGDWTFLPSGQTYTNISGGDPIEAPLERISFSIFNGTSWALVDMGELPQAINKIPFWEPGTYSQGDQRTHNGQIWSVNVASTTQEPGTGMDWIEVVNKITKEESIQQTIDLLDGAVEVPNLLPTDVIIGYFQAQTRVLNPNVNYRSTPIIPVQEGDIFSMEGYMQRSTAGSSAIEIVLMKPDQTFIKVDLKNTTKYTYTIPTGGYDGMTIVYAYNFNGTIDLTPYESTFRLYRGELSEARVVTSDNITSDGDNPVSQKGVYDFVGQIAEFPNILETSPLMHGYYHPGSRGFVASERYRSTPIFPVQEGDVFNLKGYMDRGTVAASNVHISLLNPNGTWQYIDLKNTTEYRQVIPANVDAITVVVAFDPTETLDLSIYDTSFKLIKGDILEPTVKTSNEVTPTGLQPVSQKGVYDFVTNNMPSDISGSDYMQYGATSKYRDLATRNAKMNIAVQSLRNLKTAGSGEKVINIANESGVDIENAIVILNLHHGSQTGYNKMPNDFFMDGLSKTDFSDVRILDMSDNLLDIYKASSGNYEVVADRRMKWYVEPSGDGDGSVFGSESTPGVYHSTDNLATWTQIAPDGRLTGSNQLGDVFYFKNNNVYRRKKSENFATEYLVITGNTSITGEILWASGAFVMDDLGYLYCGPYQGEWDGKIYRSIDNGDSFQIINENEKQHCHSIFIDKTVVPNVLYANFDGDASTPNLPTSAGTLKSEDRGVTWEEIQFPFAPDFGVMWSDGEVSVGGGEAARKPIPTIHRSDNDNTDWKTILRNEQNVFRVLELNGALYFSGTTLDGNGYAKIYRSVDKGLTWETVIDSQYRNVTSTSGGWRYGASAKLTPIGDEEQLMMFYSSSNSVSYPPVRVYEGGNHYQALYYVRVPLLPASGMDIKIGYGYLTDDVEGEVFQEADLDSEIYHFPLNDYNKTVIDSKNNVYELQNAEWHIGETTRYAWNIPFKRPYGNQTSVKLSEQLELPLEDSFSLNKNFSINLWAKLDSYSIAQKNEQFLLGRKDGKLYFTVEYDSRIGIYHNGIYAFAKRVFMDHHVINHAMITITISNDTIPIMRVYRNGWLAENLPVTLDGFEAITGMSNLLLGGNSNLSITDLKIFNKELSHDEVLSLYEGGRLVRPLNI